MIYQKQFTMKIQVKVIANSKQEKIEKIGEGYKVHIRAKPEKGKANLALIEFLAKEFNCRKSQIRIIRGFTSNEKTIEIKDY